MMLGPKSLPCRKCCRGGGEAASRLTAFPCQQSRMPATVDTHLHEERDGGFLVFPFCLERGVTETLHQQFAHGCTVACISTVW
jgi:hypothetical protein